MRSLILSMLMVAALSLFVMAPAFGQMVADPNDRLYTDLEIWMDRGLTGNLPPMRPYPIQLVKKALSDVEARGTEADRQLASWYLSKIDGGANVHGIASAEARTDTEHGYLQLFAGGSLQGSYNPWITYSTQLGLVGMSSLTYSYLMPEYQRTTLDYVQDTGVASVKGLFPRFSLIGGAAIGTDEIYLQAGALRGSYGPFWGDNAVVSPTSPESGQFAFVFHNSGMAGNIVLMDISATNVNGGDLSPDKFLSIGGLEFYPSDWLTLGVFDEMVWGQSFDPLYLLPVVSFYTEGMAGYPDNAFIGLSGSVKLPEALRIDFLLNIDDAAFNDLIRLDFNTMILAALQIGLSWTPDLPYLKRLSVTNLLITPYTYSHVNYSSVGALGPNYLNYTNDGQNIGPSIWSNSDRVELNALIRPVSWVDVNPFATFIIHGNATVGPNADGTPNDGSINDTGTTSQGFSFDPPTPLPAGYGYLRFLTQSVLEEVLQLGFDAAAYLDTPLGDVMVSLSYTFQYVLNGNVPGQGPVEGNNSIGNYLAVGVQLTY